MRYDTIIDDDIQRMDEVWAGLKNWLNIFMPEVDKEMYGSAREMERYTSYFINQFMRFAARYKDPDGQPLSRRTLDHVPLNVLYLFMRRAMELDDREINAILRSYNVNPVTAKQSLKLDRPMTINNMRKQIDKEGTPITIGYWFTNHGLNDKALGQEKDMQWIGAERFINQLISIAATRKMEIDQLSDEPVQDPTTTTKRRVNTAPDQQQAPQRTPLTGFLQQQVAQQAAQQAADQAAQKVAAAQQPQQPLNLPAAMKLEPLTPEEETETEDDTIDRIEALLGLGKQQGSEAA